MTQEEHDKQQMNRKFSRRLKDIAGGRAASVTIAWEPTSLRLKDIAGGVVAAVHETGGWIDMGEVS